MTRMEGGWVCPKGYRCYAKGKGLHSSIEDEDDGDDGGIGICDGCPMVKADGTFYTNDEYYGYNDDAFDTLAKILVRILKYPPGLIGLDGCPSIIFPSDYSCPHRNGFECLTEIERFECWKTFAFQKALRIRQGRTSV